MVYRGGIRLHKNKNNKNEAEEVATLGRGGGGLRGLLSLKCWCYAEVYEGHLLNILPPGTVYNTERNGVLALNSRGY